MKRQLGICLLAICLISLGAVIAKSVQDGKAEVDKPAVVKMSDGLRRDVEAIFTQINLLSQQAQNKVLKEQIDKNLGPDYEPSFQDYSWHLKETGKPKEQKP